MKDSICADTDVCVKDGILGSVVYEYIYMDCDSTHRICEIFCVYKKVSERR